MPFIYARVGNTVAPEKLGDLAIIRYKKIIAMDVAGVL